MSDFIVHPEILTSGGSPGFNLLLTRLHVIRPSYTLTACLLSTASVYLYADRTDTHPSSITQDNIDKTGVTLSKTNTLVLHTRALTHHVSYQSHLFSLPS